VLLILGFEGDQAYFGLFCLILSLQIVTKSPRWQIRCTSSLPEPTALIYNILEERFHTLSLRWFHNYLIINQLQRISPKVKSPEPKILNCQKVCKPTVYRPFAFLIYPENL